MKQIEQWKSGFKDGIPICLGYFAVSFTFGIKAGIVGLTVFQTVLISVTNVTSAGQFAGIDMIAYGASYMEMALAQLVLNIRYCLMSCSLSQKLESNLFPVHRFFIAYGVTDEIFGVTICHDGKLNPYYSYGVMSSAVPGWIFGTFFGIVFGNIMPVSVLNALGIAIYAMFIAIIIPKAKESKSVRLVVLGAMVCSMAFYTLPIIKQVSAGFRTIIITVLIAGIAAWLCPINEENTNER
ncbi:AzlC family ABC transporter permease [Lachnotalea glycerini]|uniref:Branched-chain amino acid ABC transporter permease n=1 Tax=Lachnotalea glycerini TaxID=1763509 RepID=A0A371JET5_9FIRM|nr:AzlC family ABC transporter permease [Lachnotalea glycerini]RDY31269.1 branched-chain amino acid ABC transporter permease [Lachnotalea glycerini]